MTDQSYPSETENNSEERQRLAIIELRARLAKMEVELLAARRLSVDEITAKSGPFSFFDRHGILGLMFAVFVQTAGVIWWASTITGKVNDLQSTIARQQTTQDMMARTIQDNAERLTRVQTVQENVVKILDQHTFQDRAPPTGQDRFSHQPKN